MWKIVVAALTSILASITKYIPLIGAYISGKKSTKADVLENNLDAKTEAEDVGKKVEDEIRDKPTGDYIRHHDI